MSVVCVQLGGRVLLGRAVFLPLVWLVLWATIALMELSLQHSFHVLLVPMATAHDSKGRWSAKFVQLENIV